jgi:hypothetical protein
MSLPVDNHLVERSPDGTSRPLPSEKYYVPAYISRGRRQLVSHRARISNPVDVFFDNSPAFRPEPEAARRIRPVCD